MEIKQKIEEMKEISAKLREASKAYYAQDREIMTNFEYDALYDRLAELEKETGTILSGSPTQTVGYEVVDFLPKETHESPMLSLDKTKEREALRAFIGMQNTLLSWKMDGLTVVLTYENGELVKAVTRGNGTVGEVITPNARVFQNLPLRIPYTGRLILRGEAIITYSDFEKINAAIEDVNAKYKNPRNLCSGSVRQLDSAVTARRNVRFYAFALVQAQDVDMHNSRKVQMEWLRSQGFEVVEYRMVTADTLDPAMDAFAQAVQTNDFPSDGLVALYDDILYGESLGTTAKFPRNAYAFKWADEIRETRLLEIEWSPSRTGLINPVAIFEPVELEGTTVSRASVHNVSIVRSLKLGIGDTLEVFKANMIIPQIARNLTQSDTLRIPEQCPVCGSPTQICQENDVQTLYCTNPDCTAKKLGAFTLFVSRDAMNIDGLSEATLEKLIGEGFIHVFPDIFELEPYKEKIIELDGFQKRSCEKLLSSIEAARKTTLPRMVYALGIPGIGTANAKVLCRYFDQDLERLMAADETELASIDSIGPVLAASVCAYFADEKNRTMVNRLRALLTIETEAAGETQSLAGKVFVITGSVEQFANRSQLKNYIESLGGKVTGSVTGKTHYLINNDVNSTSSKNKKARELGVPILSEADFIELAGAQKA